MNAAPVIRAKVRGQREEKGSDWRRGLSRVSSLGGRSCFLVLCSGTSSEREEERVSRRNIRDVIANSFAPDKNSAAEREREKETDDL